MHRDLKPENLLITADGRLKIADFGIAKAVDSFESASGFATRPGTAVGTLAYVAPEQAMADQIGPATDLYATGVIAYELVSGDVPFGRGDDEPFSVMLRHINEPVRNAAVRDARQPSPADRIECWLAAAQQPAPPSTPPVTNARASTTHGIAIAALELASAVFTRQTPSAANATAMVRRPAADPQHGPPERLGRGISAPTRLGEQT